MLPSLHPEDGGSMVLRNVSILSQHYTASEPRTPRIQTLPPCKSQYLINKISFTPLSKMTIKVMKVKSKAKIVRMYYKSLTPIFVEIDHIFLVDRRTDRSSETKEQK
jgi:hypothetical protein